MNPFVRHMTFPLFARREGLGSVLRSLRGYQRSQFWTREAMEAHQITRLRALLAHAAQHTPYYRTLMREGGFDPRAIRSVSDLGALPILTKSIIRERLSDLLADNIAPRDRHASTTGGTTGVRFDFHRDNACLEGKEAARFRFENWIGWSPGEWMGVVWPARQDYLGAGTRKQRLVNYFFRREVVCAAAVPTEEEMAAFTREARRRKVTAVRAFPQCIFELSRWMHSEGIHLPSVRGVATTGEPLYDWQRTVIEEAFGCRVFDSYRARETGPIAQECEQHDGLHVSAETVIVELVPEEEAGLEAGLGRVVITDLLNYGMPFIRYDMGDYAAWKGGPCACGRGLPVLEKITGRVGDVTRTQDGRSIAGGSLALYFTDLCPEPIGQMQIVQDRYDHLLIRLTPDPKPSEGVFRYLREAAADLYGNGTEVDFEIVETIPRSPSGKYQFIVCEIRDGARPV